MTGFDPFVCYLLKFIQAGPSSEGEGGGSCKEPPPSVQALLDSEAAAGKECRTRRERSIVRRSRLVVVNHHAAVIPDFDPHALCSRAEDNSGHREVVTGNAIDCSRAPVLRPGWRNRGTEQQLDTCTAETQVAHAQRGLSRRHRIPARIGGRDAEGRFPHRISKRAFSAHTRTRIEDKEALCHVGSGVVV